MTQKEFKALLADELRSQQETLIQFKKLIKDPKYEPTFADVSNNCNIDFVAVKLYTDETIDGLKEKIKDLESKTKPHKKKLRFNSGVNVLATSYGDGAEIDEFELKATWYEPLSIDSPILEAKAKNICREKLKQAIRAKTNVRHAYFNVDCKLVGLWLEEKIDFDTLAELTTSNCKL
jgi:hypothetical protein